MINNSIYKEQLKKSAFIKIDWSQLENKTVLITGATGMIATYLIDLLMYRNIHMNSNIKIIAVSRNKSMAYKRFEPYLERPMFRYESHDINEPIELKGKCDYIIQAASNTHPLQYVSDPIGTITTNIIGTKNILEYALDSQVRRVVFLSSVEIYGENRGDTEVFDETYCGYIDCNTLRAGYPEGKRAAEALCQAYIEKYNMDIVIPRLSRVYGPTMQKNDSKAIAQFITKAINKEDIILKSKGNQLYSYIYVADAVSAILYILLHGKKGEAYNISDAQSDITLKELAQMIAAISEKEIVIEEPKASEAKGYSKATKAILDSRKLNALGWNSKYSIMKGLTDTVEILSE